jgi:L-gulonate 5-dehydrogenase
MLAVRVDEPYRLGVVEVQDPQPGADEVLLRVRRAGICGSDVHIYHGANPFARYPRIIGHEVLGQIIAVGDEVDGLAVGERVVIDPVISCGRCRACRIGRSNVCANLQVIGVHRDGGMGEILVVPTANALPVPPQVGDREATLAEPFSIAANVLERTGIDEGETVLIYGAGTVGLTTLQVARMHGAQCIVVDLDDTRLARARRLGADHIANPRNTQVAQLVADLTAGEGVPLVVGRAGCSRRRSASPAPPGG